MFFFFLMIRRPPRSTLDRSSAASDVYKRQINTAPKRKEATWGDTAVTGALRMGVPIAGGLATGLLTANPLVGLGASGVLGGGGETLAQKYEIARGLRDDYSATDIGINAAANLVPGFGKAPGVGAGVKEIATVSYTHLRAHETP